MIFNRRFFILDELSLTINYLIMILLKLKAFKVFLYLSILFLISLLQLRAQSLKLSEIMFKPVGSNNEFIELFNLSDNETIDLTDYKILYHTSTTADAIISLNSNYILKPQNYAVIFEGDYDFDTGIYKEIIPDSTLILKLSDNAFGRSGMANSSNRTIYLLNAENDTLDSYTYSANNNEGFSDERISYNENSWGNSIVNNGTPGKENSISIKQYDLSILNFSSLKHNVIVGSSVELKVKIKNLGLSSINQFELNIFNDKNFDEISQQNEIIYSKSFSNLITGDSLSITIDFVDLVLGKNNFIAIIQFENDEIPDNNKRTLSIYGISQNELKNKLVINEIMYAPISPEPEWIELFNASDTNISLNQLKIADAKDTITISKQINILSNNFLILCDDTSFFEIYNYPINAVIVTLPTLNNGEDIIIVMDSLNRVIDSIAYSSTMGGNNGISLERVSSEIASNIFSNWKESLIKSTPGKINSVTQKNYDLQISNITTTPTFPLINDELHFTAHIKNIGKNKIDFNIELYSDENLDSLKDNLLETSSVLSLVSNDSLVYNFGFSDTLKNKKRSYIFRIKQTDDDTTNNIKVFTILPGYPPQSIVINEIMFLPTNDEPEWIELYNKSDYNIDISNWQVGDVLTNPIFKTISENQFIFPKKTFLVISKSNSIQYYHHDILSPVIELKFANLNNDVDGVVIKDNRSATIDSVLYTKNFNRKNGYSIERVNNNIVSTNPNNWKVSLDIENSTPGRINSVTPKNYDLVIKELSVTPNNPVTNSKIKIKTKIINRGNFNADNFSITFYHKENQNRIELESQTNLSLTASDSLTIISNNEISIRETIVIAVNAEFSPDEDIINNYTEKEIAAGFNVNTVLINEIMFNPKNGEPEWIELINNTDTTINIGNWSISDSQSKNLITTENIFIPPKEFFIVSNYFQQNTFPENTTVVQTNLPNYSNSKDAVVLYDFRNAVIDSAFYQTNNFIPKGISLERISLKVSSKEKSNWMFSLNAEGSTPGKENSIINLPGNNFGDIVINEIMYEPDSSNCEFIELFNSSSEAIELGGWRIEDEDGNYFYVSHLSKILQPGFYFVVSADSSIFNNYSQLNNFDNISIRNTSSLNLSNSGELLYLKDFKGEIIDSISYKSKWHNTTLANTKNISLELINPKLKRNNSSNWSSCVNQNGATPEKQNSIYVEKRLSKSKINISPNPFSPDNDGFEDFTFITYKLTQPIAQIRIRIYDSKGRLVRTLVNNILSGSDGTITFDGLDENNNPLRIGIYIVFFEAVNSSNTVVETMKAALVIAKKL
jgi:hypothetical protein